MSEYTRYNTFFSDVLSEAARTKVYAGYDSTGPRPTEAARTPTIEWDQTLHVFTSDYGVDAPPPLPNAAIKHDSGKPRIGLFPSEALDGAAAVLTYGATKYPAHNWREAGGLAWSRVYDAAMRHMLAFNRGEDLDPESGLPHIDHALCCMAFLSTYQKTATGTDDRHGAQS